MPAMLSCRPIHPGEQRIKRYDPQPVEAFLAGYWRRPLQVDSD
jgi:hypothetical protein